MGVDTNFRGKGLNVNTAWRRYALDKNVTISREGTFDPSTSFFTIGSCFANELRHALEERKFRVLPAIDPSIHHLFPEEFKGKSSWGAWDERAQLQFYNTFSIRQEFEKAFGQWSQADDDYFAVTHAGDTKYWDPYRRSLYAKSPEDFATLKNRLDANLSGAIHDANAVVITLGMTEVFFRKDNKLAVCQYNRYFSDLVDFRATSFAENLANLDRICELYFGKYPDRKIVVTVSPVGLAQTFTTNDVVVANSESKSILRVVAAEIAKKWPNVVYWPSYEIVMWNDNSWQPDIRHVQPDRVASIMDAFVECHISGVTSNDSTETWAKREADIAVNFERKHAKMLAAVEKKAAEKARLTAEKNAKRDEALRLKEERRVAAIAARESSVLGKLQKLVGIRPEPIKVTTERKAELEPVSRHGDK